MNKEIETLRGDSAVSGAVPSIVRHPEYQYLNTLNDIITTGERVSNRTGVDTYRLLGVTHRYDFNMWGFPLFTTKRTWWKGIVHELIWFLKGDTNIKNLVDNDVNIWNDDAYRWYLQETNFRKTYPAEKPLSKEEFIRQIKEVPSSKILGELGPIYGAQWRDWDAGMKRGTKGLLAGHYWVDQIGSLVGTLKNDPSSRRHIVSAWNVGKLDEMALPPCHILSQYTISNGRLWCHMYQRSCDMFLGVPFNVASYSLLVYMLAHVIGVEPGGFIHTMHDAHIYENHIDAVKEQLTREPKPFPSVQFTELADNYTDPDQFHYDDIVLSGYDPHTKIKAELVT